MSQVSFEAPLYVYSYPEDDDIEVCLVRTMIPEDKDELTVIVSTKIGGMIISIRSSRGSVEMFVKGAPGGRESLVIATPCLYSYTSSLPISCRCRFP